MFKYEEDSMVWFFFLIFFFNLKNVLKINNNKFLRFFFIIEVFLNDIFNDFDRKCLLK